MKNITKKEKMRDLMCFAINSLIANDIISLDKSNNKESGYFITDILGRSSLILWRECLHKEVQITLFWGYHSKEIQSTPLDAKSFYTKLRELTDLQCSCYIERMTGKWIQGYDKSAENNGLFYTYCSKKTAEDLLNIPKPQTKGYSREGAWIL